VTIDLDHTAFAVSDAVAWARRLRRELGAAPVAGEALAEFRWVQLGLAGGGAKLELLEPAGPGFLTRFLERHGEGPHHLTFTVPDLREAVARVRELGLTVVGEQYGDPGWQEAFVSPDAVHRTVVQLAQTDDAYLEHEEAWWTPVRDEPAGPATTLGPTHLGSSDLDATRRLFVDVLGADVDLVEDGLVLTWPGGSLVVRRTQRPGVRAVSLEGGPAGGISIGDVVLGRVDGP
jgi:catechol 2,3-dioxygenase-like lactoylglutathione lyase family enzyme